MRRILMAALLIGLSGCDDGDPEPAPDAGAAAPTWHGEIAALVTTHCAGCHVAGGAAPFPLDTFEAASPLADAIVDSVSAGRMPPWNPDPDCRTFERQRVLPPGALEALSAWAAAGAPVGEDVGAPLPEPPRVDFRADIVASSSEPYLPAMDTPDDYRCLVLDADFERDTFVRGVQVVPDQGPLVHHVLMYAIPPSDVPTLEMLDAEHDGPGYPCFGGVQVGLPTTLAGWVPGAEARIWSDERAIFVPADSKLVIQVHYNLTSAPLAPDQTEVHLMTTTEAPSAVIAAQPLATLDLHIPANDSAATITRDFTWYGEAPFEIIGIAGHMHLLGTHMSAQIIRADARTECLLDIPRWDFAWQESFVLAEPTTLHAGDTVRLSCTFDNSMANQPVVNGEQLAPRDVRWGEGTLDEMCYAGLIRATPFADARLQTERCAATSVCREECAEPDSFECFARCVREDLRCGQCMLSGFVQCGGAGCGAQLSTAQKCITQCLLFSGDPDACMTDRCPAEYEAVDSCLREATGGVCPALDECG